MLTRSKNYSLFVRLVADGWCWFVLREKYCWLVGDGWFVLREKYCWLVASRSVDFAESVEDPMRLFLVANEDRIARSAVSW
jgi:hypothetical protein